MMVAGIRVTQEEAENRFNKSGLKLLGQYKNQLTKVRVYCATHDFISSVFPGNIFKGQRAFCCGNASRSVKHTGKVVSQETRAKLMEYVGDKHHQFGKPRTEETKLRVSESLKRVARASVDYAIFKSSTGKTSGKPGYFYIARDGNGFLKFGSIVKMTSLSRMVVLRRDTGGAELLLLVKVQDAGAYESAMMDVHRDKWDHGEYFRDFRIDIAA